MNLLNDDSDSENDVRLKINEDYAQRYDKWRKSEELQKLKDKYGDGDDGESSTSEEEDETAVELTEDVERDFFKTLSCLKEKNPKIYDSNVQFFREKPVLNKSNSDFKKTKKKEETLTMAAYQRKMLLETGGVIEESAPKFEDLSMVEQEKSLRESFRDVLNDSDDDDDDDCLLREKKKTNEETEKEEADYRQWLAGQKSNINNDEVKEMKGLRDYWANPDLNQGEAFLRDYILNHRYLEKNETPLDEDKEELDSADDVEQQEEFERKFNFRFEEPDQDFIKRYPRTVEQSMRKKDDRRKQHREELKTRKETERAKKAEELKRLKVLKRAEIMDKIKKLKEVTGNEEMPFQDFDVEGDFNPNDHDQRMSELFNEEFYGGPVDDEKPVFPDLDKELEIENWDDWNGETELDNASTELHCEDPGFVMDCDYDVKAAAQQEILENTKKRKKRRQSKFAAAVAQQKPSFDPKSKTFEQYLDEYYSLDYEDLIGDIPCRFKYRKVVPNDYGLSVDEILSADDKELNRWVSMKKLMQRRPEHVEVYDVTAYRKKAMNINKKMQCLPSLYQSEKEDEDETEVANNVVSSSSKLSSEHEMAREKRKSKKGNKEKNVNEVGTTSLENIQSVNSSKKRKRRVNSYTETDTALDSGFTKKNPKTAPTETNLSTSKSKKGNKEKYVIEEHTTILENNQSVKISKKRKRRVNTDTTLDSGFNKKKPKTAPTETNLSTSNAVPKGIKKSKKNKNIVVPTTGTDFVSSSLETQTKKSFAIGQTVKTDNGENRKKIPSKSEVKSISDGLSNLSKKNKSNINSSLSLLSGENIDKGIPLYKKDKKQRKSNAVGPTINGDKTKNNPLVKRGEHKKLLKAKIKSNGRQVDVSDSLWQDISDARLKSYGLNPKKFKNKMKYAH